jgi:uncharacterized protein (DUF58 family)
MSISSGTLTDLSLVFATVTGAAGFALSLVAWRLFRGSPFGRALGILPVFMLLVTVYHPVLLLFPSRVELELALESVAFVLLVVFAALSIRQHRRLSRRPRSGR